MLAYLFFSKEVGFLFICLFSGRRRFGGEGLRQNGATTMGVWLFFFFFGSLVLCCRCWCFLIPSILINITTTILLVVVVSAASLFLLLGIWRGDFLCRSTRHGWARQGQHASNNGEFVTWIFFFFFFFFGGLGLFTFILRLLGRGWREWRAFGIGDRLAQGLLATCLPTWARPACWGRSWEGG